MLLPHGGELGQDRAAALDLLAQEAEILGDRAFLRQDVVELLGDEGDGGERRAELVRRRRREAVELGQVLLPGEDELRRGEGLGELARLLRHPPGIDAGEGRAEEDRRPDPGHVDEGQVEPLAGKPRQWPVHEDEKRRRADREEAEPEGSLRRERRRGDEHRRQHQHREGVLEAAGQVEQGRELEEIEGEEQGRGIVGQAMARRKADAQGEIDPGRERDDEEAEPERQRKAEAELDEGDRRRLAGDGEPAQPDEGVEPQAAGVVRQIGGRSVRHRAQRIGLLRPPSNSAGAAGARRRVKKVTGAKVRRA